MISLFFKPNGRQWRVLPSFNAYERVEISQITSILYTIATK